MTRQQNEYTQSSYSQRTPSTPPPSPSQHSQPTIPQTPSQQTQPALPQSQSYGRTTKYTPLMQPPVIQTPAPPYNGASMYNTPVNAPSERIYIPNADKPKRRFPVWAIVGGMVALGVGFALTIGTVILVLALSIERVPDGVSVAAAGSQVDLSGASAEAAQQRLASQFGSPSFTAIDESRQWIVSAAQLGVSIDIPATIDAALNAPDGATIAPIYNVDLVQTQNGLFALSEQTNIEPMNGEVGRALDVPVLLDRFMRDASGELLDGVIELPMIVVEPPPPQFSDFANVSTTERTTHIVEAGEELGLIAREYGVAIDDILVLNDIPDPNLIYVGQELIIPAAGIYQPTAADAPPAPRTNGKAILVSTTEQRIYAYENGQLVRSHLVSTGLPATPTVLGDYNIYVKYLADDMRGADYFLPQVPYTMYFYQGYAIHGTYWHNAFGRPMSHGCVNLPVSEAEWFFNWADMNTLVRVV